MSNKFNKKIIILLAGFLFLSITLLFALKLVGQKQEVRKRAAGTGKVKVSLVPSTKSVQPGETLTINIQLEAQEQVQIGTGGVDLQFDTNFFSIQESSLSCNGNFLSTKIIGRVEGNKISLTCYKLSPFPILTAGQKINLGSLQATVLPNASGQTQINFLRTEIVDNNYNDVSNTGTGGNYTTGETSIPPTTPTPEATPTPTSTPTPTPPPGEVKIKFRVKFEGVYDKKGNQNVRLKIGKDQAILQELSDVILTSDDQGVYESPLLTLSSAVTSGSNYYILIKGPKHLQVKFCQNSGQSRPCTNGMISLNNGENILDFTGYPLPGGDLPPQDGIVNAMDAVAMVNCLFDSSSQCINKADLNFDGAVNTMDINIMNNTIYSRWEDE